MKCEKHPETDAVGACVSCGRGVCPICKLSYNNMLHCKECIEAGRVGGHQYSNYWGGQGTGYQGGTYNPQGQIASTGQTGYGQAGYGQASYPYSYGYYPYVYYPSYYGYGTYGLTKATPQPKGSPNGALFKIGVAGCIFLAIVSLIQGFMIMNVMTMSQHSEQAQMTIVGSIMLMMAMFPFGLGVFGFYKNYGSVWGMMGSMAVLISSVLYPVLLYMSILYARSTEYSYSLDQSWLYMAHMTLGVSLILAGLAINQAKRFFEVERQVQGMLTFGTAGLAISGILFCAFLGMFLIGWIAMAVSLFMLSMEFYNAPVPAEVNEEERAKTDFFNPDGTPRQAPAQQPQQQQPVQDTPVYKTNPSYATQSYPEDTGSAAEKPIEVETLPTDQPAWTAEKKGF